MISAVLELIKPASDVAPFWAVSALVWREPWSSPCLIASSNPEREVTAVADCWLRSLLTVFRRTSLSESR